VTGEEEGASLLGEGYGFDDERDNGDISDDERGMPEEEERDRSGSDGGRYACDFLSNQRPC
jgi:hypothetical protein